MEARRASIRTGYGDRSRIWLLLATDHLSLSDTLAALAALDSAEAMARTDADRTAARELRAALVSAPDLNQPN